MVYQTTLRKNDQKKLDQIKRHWANRRPAEDSSVATIDAQRDTTHAWVETDFSRVCHVFHNEWIGIRSACGNLPGRKISISADQPFDRADVEIVGERLLDLQVGKFVFHGFSANMHALIVFLSAAGASDGIYIVIHGSSPQWVFDIDRGAITDVLNLAKKGKIRRFHIMKRGQRTLLPSQFAPVLYNLPPKFTKNLMTKKRDEGIIAKIGFVPGWSSLHKNIYTNIIGALQAPSLDEVWTYAPPMDLSAFSGKRLVQKPHGSRDHFLEQVSRVSICLNASLLDCHPMVNIEAQAVGVPCIRGPLFLDHGEDHEYVALTQVSDVCSMIDIADAVERCMAVSDIEMQDMIKDYQGMMSAVALQRYREFLEF